VINSARRRCRALLIFVSLSLVGVTVQFLAAQADSLTSQIRADWHQHSGPRLEPASPFIDHPAIGDTIPIRISGVWRNRTQYNLWLQKVGAAVPISPCLVHGYIDETDATSVPRYKFVGRSWRIRREAIEARLGIIRAFIEWSSVGSAPGAADSLRTGLEFREVPPDSEAEVEIYWRRIRTVAVNHRQVNSNGVVGATQQLFFNSSTHWAFGAAAATPPDKMHFYSTALHEVGHLVGLWESIDRRSVMIHQRMAGPNGPSFDALDEASRRAAVALYSMPVDGSVASGHEVCSKAGP
jgi:hypothetical protein